MEILIGELYRHKKGGRYVVLNMAKHSETLEDMVVYQSLDYKTIWVRPLNNFIEPGRFVLEKSLYKSSIIEASEDYIDWTKHNV